jgi:hypothetical protein
MVWGNPERWWTVPKRVLNSDLIGTLEKAPDSLTKFLWIFDRLLSFLRHVRRHIGIQLFEIFQ